PSLAGSPGASRKILLLSHTHSLESLLCFLLIQNIATDGARDTQVLDCSQLVFDRVLMSQISNRAGVFFAQRSNTCSIPSNFTGSRHLESAKNSQQAGLAAAVGSSLFY